MHRARQFRLYPTPDQEGILRQYAGASRFVFNIALEQRRDWHRQFRVVTGRAITWASQSKELTELRKQVGWLAKVPRSICEQALRDVDKAFANLRRGSGFPTFRSIDRNNSFRIQGRDCRAWPLNRKWAMLRIPGVGEVKLRMSWPVPNDAVSVAVRDVAGKWVATLTYEVPSQPPQISGDLVGIDRGVANTVALSNGERYSMPEAINVTNRVRKRQQRILARRKKGSRRRAKQRLVVARTHRSAAATRAHWLHERSTDIARRFGVVVIEALKVSNMTRSGAGKRGLNRSILEQGWSIFAHMLAYKLEDRGGTLHLVNPAYTSQTCSECGSVNAKSRKSQAVFECVDCGHAAHADTNAAINILRRSPAGVEGTGYGPVEARTGEMLKHLENLAV